MTITEALKILQKAPRDAPPFSVRLACGFTPLHQQTFLTAYLQQALPERRVSISTGLYGDLVGTLEAAAGTPCDAVFIALEWPDLDSRLGFRSTAEWSQKATSDITSQVRPMLHRIAAAIAAIPSGPRIALMLPTLPFPPMFHTSGWQASAAQLAIERDLLDFAAELAAVGRVSVLNPRRLLAESPASAQFDLKAELLTGLPYTLRHAAIVSELAARLLVPPAPKKGIITDLDDTLWNGILGEVGVAGIAWDLSSHSHLHGLYQKLLASLSENGVLIGVASKNDALAVRQAFERTDLLLRADRVFPMEVHWNAKSGSITQILKTWNIAADSVIFVDDSPMELAEVAAAHPGIECQLFPKNDYAAGLALLRQLRDQCGKEQISLDDSIRLTSIRQNDAFREQARTATPETFLKETNAVITFNLDSTSDPRALELVNKTNQFNLNGIRWTAADWQRQTSASGAVTAAVSYEDKFGVLGTIAVIQGRQEASTLTIETWVMSCRAFARRIEYQCLRVLFEQSGASQIRFQFAATAKNGPLQDFFETLIGQRPTASFTLSRTDFEARCPALYHRVETLVRANIHG